MFRQWLKHCQGTWSTMFQTSTLNGHYCQNIFYFVKKILFIFLLAEQHDYMVQLSYCQNFFSNLQLADFFVYFHNYAK